MATGGVGGDGLAAAVFAWLGVVAALWSGDGGAVSSTVVPLPRGDMPTDEFKLTVPQPYLYTTLETVVVVGAGAVWYMRHGFSGEKWSNNSGSESKLNGSSNYQS